MKAIETAASGFHPSTAADAGAAATLSGAGEVTSWLLEGRFFTIDPKGAVTTWSPAAADAFGWRRKDIVGESFVDTLLAPAERSANRDRLGKLLAGSGQETVLTGDFAALDAAEQQLRTSLAIVPIQLGAGYEFNALLQDLSVRSNEDAAAAEVKARHESVLSLIEGALAGGGTKGGLLAGALVVFRTGAAAPSPAATTAEPVADNVVSISDAAGAEEARAQLERARKDAEEGRVEIRSLEGQLEEARREAQRSRTEVDVARQESADARDALIVGQREAEETQRLLEESRRSADEVRAAAEGARIRAEESQREADSLRAQLREARESVRGMAGRADDELAEAQEKAAVATRELADARAEAARHEAEVAPLRERYQAAQRQLGGLRADLESAQAAAAERETVGARRAGELARAREELEERKAEAAEAQRELESRLSDVSAKLDKRKAEIATLREDLARRPGDAGAAPDHELQALRERLDRMRAAFDRAPLGSALIAPDGRYLEVSDALCEMLGHARDELLSPDPPAIVHPDDVDSHRDLARRILAGEQAGSRGLRRYLHADGHPVSMRESVALVRDAEGRPSMFVVQLEEAQGGEPREGAVVEGDVAGEAMQRALEDDLFHLHCQPILDLHTNTVTQYELLIRMTGEDGRLMLPEAFLGPARRAGLAHSIDRWVVRKAIGLLQETAGREASLEVNLSPEAVHDSDLPGLIDEELTATGVDPGRLVLEVSGDTASEHLDETRALAKRLRGIGCRFALDAFRSNFGSFRLLRELPLDYLKLDGELVESLAESRTSQLIVKALVDVAAGTGMKTVAVFVSDEQTLMLLRQHGVDYAQGYTVGRPRPVEDVLDTRGEPPRLPPG